MIISRTPLRISIGGGGTDLPSYYERFGGFVISAAMDRYVYVAIHNAFQPAYLLKYSQQEHVDSIDAIAHPIIREALRLFQVQPGIEIVSLADIPAGTGLGSSGAFNVGLLKALTTKLRQHATPASLAEIACRIEIDILHEPIGKQDQYIAAFGGMSCMEFHPDGRVDVSPLAIEQGALDDLEEHLMLFFTGYSRSASAVLQDQKTKSEHNDTKMIDNLHAMKDIGYRTKEALEKGNTHAFGELMHEHWLIKRARSESISNPIMDRWYERACASGAIGGKLIGAGGGGFFMFYTTDKVSLRQAMREEGLMEVRFGFDHAGSTILVAN